MKRDKIVELVQALEDEVNNGGFHQFFYNDAGDNALETIKALETIGAIKTADVLRRAAAMFPGGIPPKERFSRQDVLLDSLSVQVFHALDDEFYAYQENLASLLANYQPD